jgi:hypothetical protein
MISGTLTLPHGGVTLPEDVTRREANCAYSEWLWTWRQRTRDWSAARVAARPWGGEKTLTEPESSGGDDEEEDESGEEGDVTPLPHSPPPKGHPSLGDICSRQVGIFIGTRRLK